MTRDDIVRMAQEAAIMPPNWGATENQWRSLEEFARLVAQAEREACAKVAEDASSMVLALLNVTSHSKYIAAAIRARRTHDVHTRTHHGHCLRTDHDDWHCTSF